MSTSSTQFELNLPAVSDEWIERIPEGSVSIETDGRRWKLRASRQLQSRFEELLDRKKAGQLSEPEAGEYQAICELDALLSGFNRLARRVQQT